MAVLALGWSMALAAPTEDKAKEAAAAKARQDGWARCFLPFPLPATGTITIAPATLPGAREARFVIEAGTSVPFKRADGSDPTPVGKTIDIESDDIIQPHKKAITLREGELLLVQGPERSYYYLSPFPSKGIVLTLADSEPTQIRAAKAVKESTAKGTEATLKEDLEVKLVSYGKRPVGLAEAPTVRPYFHSDSPSFEPVYGAFAPAGIRVRMPRGAAALEPKEVRACMWHEGALVADLTGAKVNAVENPLRGPAIADIELPAGLLRFATGSPLQTIMVAVATVDGSFAEIGRIRYVTPLWALTIASVVTAILFVAVSAGASRGSTRLLSSLFVAYDGTASISLLQMALWTVVAVWALIYVFLRTWDLLSMTPEVMGLLGFAGATTVGARLIAASRNPFAVENGTVLRIEQKSTDFRLAQLVQTDDRFDLVKFQLLIFTVLIAAYVVVRVLLDGAFPELDANFLLLMGISNGVYIGAKFATPSAFQKLESIKQEAGVLADRVKALEDEQIKLDARAKELNAAKAEAAKNKNQAQIDAIGKQMGPVQDRLEEIGDPAKDAALPRLKAARDAALEKYRKAMADIAK